MEARPAGLSRELPAGTLVVAHWLRGSVNLEPVHARFWREWAETGPRSRRFWREWARSWAPFTPDFGVNGQKLVGALPDAGLSKFSQRVGNCLFCYYLPTLSSVISLSVHVTFTIV